MLGQQFQKPLADTGDYETASAWANANGAMIEDKGSYYEVVTVPEATAEQKAATIRAERDTLLKETDLIIIRCAEAGESVPDEWKTYRQALRDIPGQEGFPENVMWPDKPEAGEALPGREEPGTETEPDPEK